MNANKSRERTRVLLRIVPIMGVFIMALVLFGAVGPAAAQVDNTACMDAAYGSSTVCTAKMYELQR